MSQPHRQPSGEPGEFQGNARYQVIRRLGSGGMGVVYEAVDRDHASQRIAVKVLKGRDAEALVRLKREFRALADVNHPNLVSLFDLVAESDAWFFTLELVDGIEFLEWCRPGSRGREADLPTAALEVTLPPKSGSTGLLDLDRLKSALRQLTAGVAALHAAGRLHRDLKPSNVLVTPSGRVVILDFGLVAELDGEGSISEAQGQSIVGTAAYMAPEQAGSGPVTPASDWYAVGTMLYQALTGRLPFEGTPMQAMVDKQRSAPTPPRERAQFVPPELDRLCVQLLRVDPAQRPGAKEILSALGDTPAAATSAVRAVEPHQKIVGREAEVAALQQALDRSRGGEPQIARVSGGSGIGKTALVRYFLHLAEGAGAVVLSGRCYERESVPFKALDSAIDALARHLGRLPPEKADALLPRDAWALAKMFPVLKRVEAFARMPAREVREPHELRRRASAALRELFGRMADRAPLVIFIDDLQWTDEDSAALLEQLLAPPDAPSVLLVVTSQEREGPTPGQAWRPVELPLAPLDEAESLALARRVLDEASAARAEQVSRESGGNPFLLQQLAAYEASGEAKLDEVVLGRAAQLDDTAQRLLEAICVAGRPVDRVVAQQAAGVGDSEAVLRQLKASRLVRATPAGDRERLEAWHDRIRATVVESLSAESRRRLHLALADAIVAHRGDELDALASHLAAAGETRRAAAATARAADSAAGQLAFDRAASLYRQAFELLPLGDGGRAELSVKLADALAQAGRGADAAAIYSEAITLGTTRSVELKRRRAEQLLRSGHVDRGMKALEEVVAEMGMRLPRVPWRGFVTLLYRRVRLVLRGHDYTERPAAEVDPAQLQKIDVCWSVSVGLAMIDTICGATFQSRGLLLALDAGEPYRLGRALAAEGAFVAIAGVGAERRAAALIKKAREMSLRVADPRLSALLEFCTGMTKFLVGKWAEAKDHQLEAERLFAASGSALTWEALNARLYWIWSLFYLGELKELSARVPAMLEEARRRGDRYTITSLQSGLAIVPMLAADQPDEALRCVREVLGAWSTDGFQFQHYWALLSEEMIDLYRGDGEAGWRKVEEQWPALQGSLLLRIQNVRVEARFFRGACAVSSGRLGEALADAERLEGEGVVCARAHAALLRAGVCQAKGLTERAQELLTRAIGWLEGEQMALFAQAARVRLGELEGGELGAARVKAAHAWMLAQGVKEPAKLCRLLAPRSLESGATAL